MISVIIPVYNVEKYLEKCLHSVLTNTFRDLEVICVNDGSPDNCLQILKKIIYIDIYLQKEFHQQKKLN